MNQLKEKNESDLNELTALFSTEKKELIESLAAKEAAAQAKEEAAAESHRSLISEKSEHSKKVALFEQKIDFLEQSLKEKGQTESQ